MSCQGWTALVSSLFLVIYTMLKINLIRQKDGPKTTEAYLMRIDDESYEEINSSKMKTRLTSVTYLGFTATDKRLSNAMLPWLLREIRATNIRDKLSITIEDGCLKAYNGNFEPVLVHRLVDIVRASQVPGVPEELFYILLNEKEGLLHCYLFRANTESENTELLYNVYLFVNKQSHDRLARELRLLYPALPICGKFLKLWGFSTRLGIL